MCAAMTSSSLVISKVPALLADVEGSAATAYGVKTRMLGMEIAKRQTFIIGPDGTIALHYEKVDPKTHSKEVLADLVELGAP